MKLEKRVGVYFVLFLLLALPFVFAQGDRNLDKAIDEHLEKFEDGAKNLKEFTEEDKWELLSKRWQAQLLNNSAIADIDSALKKTNPLWNFLFGVDYSLSLTFFFVVILWVFFIIFFYDIFRLYTIFSNASAFVASFTMTFLLANIRTFPDSANFLTWMATGIFKVIFFREGIWRWTSLIFFMLAYFIVLITINRTFRLLTLNKKKAEEKRRERMQRVNQEILDMYTRKITGVKEKIKAHWVVMFFLPIVAISWIFIYNVTDWISSAGTFWGFLVILGFFEIVLIYKASIGRTIRSLNSPLNLGGTARNTSSDWNVLPVLIIAGIVCIGLAVLFWALEYLILLWIFIGLLIIIVLLIVAYRRFN